MKMLFSTVLGAGLLATSTASNAAYNLIYNPLDGSLTIQTTGNIINYVLESNSPLFLEDIALTPSNHQVFVSYFYFNGVPIAIVGTSSSTPTFLGETYPYQNLPAGSYNIGNVMQPGLTKQQWLAGPIDKQTTYVANLGTPVTKFNLVYAPEPGSLAVLGLAASVLLRRRRTH